MQSPTSWKNNLVMCSALEVFQQRIKCHFEKSINHNEDEIQSLLCARKSQHEIHAQVFATIFGDGKWCIQTRILSLSFSNLANQITPHNCSHILLQFRPIVCLFDANNSLSLPKCPSSPSPCRSLKTFSLKEVIGTHNRLLLRKNPSKI